MSVCVGMCKLCMYVTSPSLALVGVSECVCWHVYVTFPSLALVGASECVCWHVYVTFPSLCVYVLVCEDAECE